MTADYVGWIATAVFVGSYACARADALRRVQMIGALLWVCYGVLTTAAPVVAANLLVLAAAFLASRRARLSASASGHGVTGTRSH